MEIYEYRIMMNLIRRDIIVNWGYVLANNVDDAVAKVRKEFPRYTASDSRYWVVAGKTNREVLPVKIL